MCICGAIPRHVRNGFGKIPRHVRNGLGEEQDRVTAAPYGKACELASSSTASGLRWHEGWRAVSCWGSRLSGGEGRQTTLRCVPTIPLAERVLHGWQRHRLYRAACGRCASREWRSSPAAPMHHVVSAAMTSSSPVDPLLYKPFLSVRRTGKRQRFGTKQRAHRGAGNCGSRCKFSQVQDGKKRVRQMSRHKMATLTNTLSH